jgi:cellulose biosynthesis protein BcsQ
MYTITFYSFKGGVGRTMALVNVGFELARRGRRVLLVDFDLEAPGLTTYAALHKEGGHPGMVEFVSEYIRTREAPEISSFLYEVDLAKVKRRRTGGKLQKTRAGVPARESSRSGADSRQSSRSGPDSGRPTGQLWVMPAGKGDAAYGAALASINWNWLYENLDGYLFFEDTKLQWQQTIKPDYVLIDSRTGHTDVGGICTRQLADAVVLLFTPNEQNLAGLETVCRDIRREETEGLKKPIRLHFVAANVPDLDDERGILRRQIQTFRERLNFTVLSGVIRRYENLNLLDQSVFTLERPHSRLARSFRRLLRTLLKENVADRDGALCFLRDYPKWMEDRKETTLLISFQSSGEDRVKPPEVEEDKKYLHRIAKQFNSDVEILNRVAECFIKEEAYKSACGVLDRILQLEPNRAYALRERANCKTKLFQLEEAAEDLLAAIRILGLPPEKRPSNDRPRHLIDFDYDRHAHDVMVQHDLIENLLYLAPGKIEELVGIVEKRQILVLAGILCKREEGVPIAARLLRQRIAAGEFVDAAALLRARCWKEVIRLTEGKIDNGKDADEYNKLVFSPKYTLGWPRVHGKAIDTLELILAHWGEYGDMPESLCREVLQSDPEVLQELGWQAVALLSWRIGQEGDAMAFLDLTEQRVQAETEPEYGGPFSWWWLRDVSVKQYLDDCQLFRRMFHGELIRPAFLGKPAPKG